MKWFILARQDVLRQDWPNIRKCGKEDLKRVPLAEHVGLYKHSINWDNFKILEVEISTLRRKFLESFHIQANHTKIMNRVMGILPPIYVSNYKHRANPVKKPGEPPTTHDNIPL